MTFRMIWVGWMLTVTVITGCEESGPSSANTAQQMFQAVISNPIPPSVRSLEGLGDTWQGYSLYLRFTASSPDIDAIIEQGFTPIKWRDCADRFTLPKGYDRFKPSWQPADIATKECYELRQVQNSWTHSGTHYLVIDRATGTVYFYGIGA